jgi:hypothetical protein
MTQSSLAMRRGIPLLAMVKRVLNNDYDDVRQSNQRFLKLTNAGKISTADMPVHKFDKPVPQIMLDVSSATGIVLNKCHG